MAEPREAEFTRPHLSTFLCDTFAGKRAGHPYRSGTARTQGGFNHDGIHSCSEQAGPCGPQPAGQSTADREAAVFAEMGEQLFV
jgi:hypothetical protein